MAHGASWQLLPATVFLERAHSLAQTQCPGDPWLLTNIRRALGVSLVGLGEMRQVEERTAAWLAEARARGDRFAIAELTGFDGLLHSTVPFGSGLSSSAAIETAVLLAFGSVYTVSAPAARALLISGSGPAISRSGGVKVSVIEILLDYTLQGLSETQRHPVTFTDVYVGLTICFTESQARR